MSGSPAAVTRTSNRPFVERVLLDDPFPVNIARRPSVDLPPEIWLLILEDLQTDRATLRICSLLNSKFNSLCNRLLWRAITLPFYYHGHTTNLWPRLFSLLDRPERARSLRKLTVVFQAHVGTPSPEPMDAYAKVLDGFKRRIDSTTDQFQLGDSSQNETPMVFRLFKTLLRALELMKNIETLVVLFADPRTQKPSICSSWPDCDVFCTCSTIVPASSQPTATESSNPFSAKKWHSMTWLTFAHSWYRLPVQRLHLLHVPATDIRDLLKLSQPRREPTLTHVRIIPDSEDRDDLGPLRRLSFFAAPIKTHVRLKTTIYGAPDLLAHNDFRSLSFVDRGFRFDLAVLNDTRDERYALRSLGRALNRRRVQILHIDLYKDTPDVSRMVCTMQPWNSQVSVISQTVRGFGDGTSFAGTPAQCCRTTSWSSIATIFGSLPKMTTYIIRHEVLPLQHGFGKLRKLKTRRQFLSFIKFEFRDLPLDRVGIRVIFEFGRLPWWAASTWTPTNEWFGFVFQRMSDGEWELYEDESRTMRDEDSRDTFYLEAPQPCLLHEQRERRRQERGATDMPQNLRQAA
ncbi:hypothetical protein DL93DRAFT_2166058 [Clavulina sp. PMI_390]|nr:hypothetical protein DL93DRAFT_2166058 [Clavulina sp. PMI_390]